MAELLRKYYGIVLLILVASLLLSTSIYVVMMNIATVDTKAYFEPVAVKETKSTQPVVNFGVISRYPPRTIYEGYQPVMDFLSDNTPYVFRLKLSNSYEETIQQLVKGEVQFAFLGTYIFLTSFQEYGLDCVLKPISEQGEPYFYGTIITREDSGIEQPEDLEEKTFAVTSQWSFSANSVQNHLRQKGISPKSVDNFKHHTTVLQKVLQGEYDAGAVRSIVAEKHIGSGLKVIYRTPPFPGGPISVKNDCDPEIVKSVAAALLSIDVTKEEYRRMVADWDPEFRYGFIEASVEDYRKAGLMLEQVGLK